MKVVQSVLLAAAMSLSLLSASAVAQTRSLAGDDVTLFLFGDSLTSGYGLPQNESFPRKLEGALRDKGYHVTVINGGVAGDTSASALSRLKWSLPKHVDAAIVELGANDAFRGEFPGDMRKNLGAIIDLLKSHGISVMLAGMLAPPNLGPHYTNDFDTSFQTVAEKHGVILYPFFLDGVAMDDKLNQDDHIHPNAKGVDIVVAHILPTVEKLLAETQTARATPAGAVVAPGAKDVPATP